MRTWQEWFHDVVDGIAAVPDAQIKSAATLIRDADITLCAGNGGSAAIASHAAQALAKPDYAAGGGCAAVCLTDCIPLLTAHANDGGWEGALVEVARPLVRHVTAYLLISSSGKSKNIIRLAEKAREDGHDVIAFTGFSGGPLKELATVSLHVPSVDYEVVEPVHDAIVHRLQAHLRG